MNRLLAVLCVFLFSVCVCGCSYGNNAVNEPDNSGSFVSDTIVPDSDDIEVIESYASILGDITDPDEVFENASHVAVITILSVDGSSNIDQRNGAYIYPYTYGAASIQHVYKGELEEGQEITYVRMGGTIGWEDYLKSLSENERQKVESLSKDNHPSYVKEVFAHDIDIEAGKTYLAYMDNEDVSMEGAYAIIGSQGGLREIVDGKVKNNFTGEYQEISDIVK